MVLHAVDQKAVHFFVVLSVQHFQAVVFCPSVAFITVQRFISATVPYVFVNLCQLFFVPALTAFFWVSAGYIIIRSSHIFKIWQHVLYTFQARGQYFKLRCQIKHQRESYHNVCNVQQNKEGIFKCLINVYKLVYRGLCCILREPHSKTEIFPLPIIVTHIYFRIFYVSNFIFRLSTPYVERKYCPEDILM